jgi:hypothetical protein
VLLRLGWVYMASPELFMWRSSSRTFYTLSDEREWSYLQAGAVTSLCSTR